MKLLISFICIAVFSIFNASSLFADDLADRFHSISRMINGHYAYKDRQYKNRDYSNRYLNIIRRVSRKWDVDPFLISSIIKHESAFDPNAISKKGACGLMQLMPKTAKEMGVTAIFDPIQNINGGTRYIRLMNDRYDGDLYKALLAYNAGPTNIDNGIIPKKSHKYAKRVIHTYCQLRRQAYGN